MLDLWHGCTKKRDLKSLHLSSLDTKKTSQHALEKDIAANTSKKWLPSSKSSSSGPQKLNHSVLVCLAIAVQQKLRSYSGISCIQFLTSKNVSCKYSYYPQDQLLFDTRILGNSQDFRWIIFPAGFLDHLTEV